MEKVYARTKGIQPDMVDGFCPGCMHSTLFKLIGEVLEEMDMLDKCTCAIGVGCCGLGMGYFTYDYLLAAHGRACAVATGAKRSNPDTLVFTYQGDGDLASIGLAETMSAANRGENISVIFVNNGIYGMTGGQLAPTTLVGMKATTAPKGRDPRAVSYTHLDVYKRQVDGITVLTLAVTAVLMAALTLFIDKTKLGKAMRAAVSYTHLSIGLPAPRGAEPSSHTMVASTVSFCFSRW